MTLDRPQLLIDTDAFCKLASADLLNESLSLLGVPKEQCARLPALPYMLQRGRLRTLYGSAEADRLRALAETFARMPEAATEWLDVVTDAPGIDPGEAQIFAVGAERGLTVLTGDKRALLAASSLSVLRSKLDRRLVTIEAVLLGLSGRMSEAVLRARGAALAKHDQMARAVFASAASPLREGLSSYFGSLEREAQPMKLWSPEG